MVQKLNVLIVEDEGVLVMSLERALKKATVSVMLVIVAGVSWG